MHWDTDDRIRTGGGYSQRKAMDHGNSDAHVITASSIVHWILSSLSVLDSRERRALQTKTNYYQKTNRLFAKSLLHIHAAARVRLNGGKVKNMRKYGGRGAGEEAGHETKGGMEAEVDDAVDRMQGVGECGANTVWEGKCFGDPWGQGR